MNAATSDSVLLLGAAGCVSRYRRGHELCRGDEAGQADGLLRGRLRYSTHRTHLAVGDCDKKIIVAEPEPVEPKLFIFGSGSDFDHNGFP